MVPDSLPDSSVELKGRRILIVDDDKINHRLLQAFLRNNGYTLTDADSGENALAAYEKHQPDLVLLDVVLPGIDGYETCQRLRKTYGKACAPIIFITAKSAPEDIVHGFEVGGVDYLTKPLKAKEVEARIRTQLENRALIEQLGRTNAAKNRLLGMAAHDLRNPLASIRGLAEFLGDGVVGPLTPDQLELVQTIRDASHSMLDLVNDLLDTATIEAGELNIRLQPENLPELVTKSIALISIEAGKKTTRIAFEPPPEAIRINADGAKIKQVIENLLSNAVKYSPRGSVVTVIVASNPKSSAVSFCVRDQGPGIPANEHNKLFKDFSRLSVKPTGGEKSTGLGLAICRKIVEAHHGTITAENLPERGCEFRVTLPLSP
jgi:signal transduction histidine kinase